jgi:type IV secretory pathway ATPase VirB11/archaellum biosynthesis ATPase
MGSYSELHTNQFDLINHPEYKIQELVAHKRNILIIGESGAGKTLFLIKLRKELEKDYNIALINLRDLSAQN